MDQGGDTLKLSFGQVAWTICQGRDPDPLTLDRLRYLRQLGVPFSEKEGRGSGNRMVYSYAHLVECGLAIECVRRGIKPMDVAKIIVLRRARLQKLARELRVEVEKMVLDRFGGAEQLSTKIAFDSTISICINDRFAKRPYSFDVLRHDVPAEPNPSEQYVPMAFDPMERDSYRVTLPLQRLILMWLWWAKSAPLTRPGRR